MENRKDLKTTKEGYFNAAKAFRHRVVICAGTGCVANGSLKVYDAFVDGLKSKGMNALVKVELKKENEGVYVSKSGCQGFCQMGPLVTIYPSNIFYTKVRPEDTLEIIEKTIMKSETIERLLYTEPSSKQVCPTTDSIPFYKKQHRYVLKSCGIIDPEDINEYIANDGYAAAKTALTGMDGKEICASIIASGLRGRGGGGFPTGKKWEITRVQPGDMKYIICNGDEGDPGAFMDRSVMEGNPHSVIEGMLIASKAIGAKKGYVYVRAEYPLAVKRMRKAVEDAAAYGFLGESILGTGHGFTLEVMEGAGAFVCGEETAMISSIEGKRGMPNPKPPFPAQSGLWGKPTVINNVETFATVPHIILHGASEFKKIGTTLSTGTKTFALTGHVVNTGLIEVPMGTTLKEVVINIAGGVTDDAGNINNDAFKAVQIGGPSGGCLTKEHFDLPLDFDSLKKAGAMVGSGGLVVMNDRTCMVGIARFFMQFTQNESCGKCVLCREGTKQMLSLLDDIIEGRATMHTLELLEELALAVQKGSLCGLGKTAPNPVLSTMKYFKDEYLAHVKDKKCPAGRCKALAKFNIDEKLCKGCTLCARKCPVSAITGDKAKPHRIDKDKCIACGACVDTCRFKAIYRG